MATEWQANRFLFYFQEYLQVVVSENSKNCKVKEAVKLLFF